jgi:hypothetical protein
MPTKNDEFARLCWEIIDERERKIISPEEAAQRILKLFPTTSVHPMLRYVEELAFDINEDIVPPTVNKKYWGYIKRIIDDYQAGKWYPTSSVLCATYSTDNQGISLDIERIKGKWIIRVADKQIMSKMKWIFAQVNSDQDEQWLLKNVELLLPEKIGEYKLTDSNTKDYLVTLPAWMKGYYF